MSQWEWNDVKLEVDLNDVSFQEKYENAFNTMAISEKDLQKAGKLSDISKGYCKMFFDLFDNIFGNGTSKKLFGEKMNVAACDDCYDSFIAFCSAQVKEINKRRSDNLKKYRPKKR
nr:MAG TPA: tail assembly chaperone protein [Caudoviricetes sp.]